MNLYTKYYLYIIGCSYILGCIISLIMNTEKILIHESNSYLMPLYGLDQFNRFKMIVSNNGIVALRYILFGLLSYGALSFLYSFYNGYVLGTVIIRGSYCLSLADIVSCTLPHIIFEEIGLCLAGYIGFMLSHQIFLLEKSIPYKKIIPLCITSILLIILSAFIESYVSMS